MSIEKAISKATRQTFTIGRIEGDFIRSIKLKDVSLKIEDELFVQLEEISVRYSLPLIFNSSMLFNRAIPLSDVSVRGLSINLIKDKDGNWNFDKLGEKKEKKDEDEKKKKKSYKWNIFVKDILLKDAKIKVEDRRNDKVMDIRIPGLNSSIRMVGITKRIELDLKKADLEISPNQINIKGFSTKAIYTSDEAQISDSRLNLNGAEIKLDGKVNDFKEPEFNFKASAHGYKLEEVGIINIEIDGSGKYKSPENIQAEIRINIPDSQIMGKKVWGSIDKIKMSGTSIEVKRGAVKTEFGEMSFGGNAELRRVLTKEGMNKFDFRISLKDIETPEIFALIEKQQEKKSKIMSTGLNAILNANFDVEGSWKEIDDLQARIMLDKFQLKGNNAGEADLKGLIEATKSNIRFDVSSNLNKVNLASILGKKKYASNITSNLDLEGSIPLMGDLLENLTATMQAKILPSSFSDIDVTEGEINASYTNGALDLKYLHLVSDYFKLRAQETRVQRKGMNFTYNLEVNNLNFISKFVPDLELEGSLKAQGKVQGEIKKPEATFSVKVSGFVYKKEDIEIKSIDLNGGGVANLKNLQFQVEGRLEKLKIRDRNIKSVDLRARSEGKGVIGDFSILEDAQRSYEIGLKLVDLKSREKNLGIEKIKLNLEDKVLENRDKINVTISPKRLIVKSFNLYYKDNFILGNADLNSDGNINADLELNNINFPDISQALELETPVQGIASGNIRLEGTIEKPKVEANISAQGLKYMKFKSGKATIDLSYLNKNLDLNLNITENGREILLVNGKANVELNFKKIGENIENATFDIVVRSSGLELSPFATLNEEIKELHGIAVIDLRASGNVKSPKINGQVKLEEASLRIQSLRNELKIPTALIEMQGQKGFLRNLEIQTEDGKGTFKGDFDLEELSYSLSGKLSNFNVESKRISAKLEGNVDVKGSRGKINISGKAKVQRARIIIPEESEKKIEEIKFVDEEEPEEFVIEDTKETDFFRENIAMDLSVRIPGNTWIRGKGANIEIQGEAEVNKQYSKPLTITGNASTIRGTYQIFGKLFKIEEGRVSFPRTTEINPLLDITALYRVFNVDIFVNIGGTARKPEIKLTSNPPMEETDIVSYLVFGTSSDKLGTGERSSLNQIAAGVAGGIAARELRDLVGEEFALDVITIGGGETSPQIELGKYLTNDLYIAYERSLTQTPTTITPVATNNIRVEYRLFDFLILQSEIGGERSGGDVFFRFDYSCPLLQ